MSLDYRIFRPFLRFVSPVGGACRSGTVVRRSRQVVLIACMALLHLAGCRREEGIRQYTVKRTESPARSIAAPSATQEGVAWFVKLTGPADAVRLQAEPFAKVVQTFTAPADGNPRFDIPSGWKASEGPPPRYQTLTISGTDPPLEVTVSALPLSTADLDEYFLANINRWRGQVKLDPIDDQALAAGTERITIDGREATFAEMIGEETGILAAI